MAPVQMTRLLASRDEAMSVAHRFCSSNDIIFLRLAVRSVYAIDFGCNGSGVGNDPTNGAFTLDCCAGPGVVCCCGEAVLCCCPCTGSFNTRSFWNAYVSFAKSRRRTSHSTFDDGKPMFGTPS